MVRSLILLVLMAGLSVATAQAGGHELTGVVHDTGLQPIVGAWVDLRPLKNGAITAGTYAEPPFQALRSDQDGRWAFAGLADGAWLLTIVTTTEPAAVPLTDEELQKLLLPGPDYRMPEGVALSRSIQRFEAGQDAAHMFTDVGLALGPRPQRPLLGQLVGAFDPATHTYEVSVMRSIAMGGTPGMVMYTSGSGGGTLTETSSVTDTATGETTSTTSITVSGGSDAPAPLFKVVPDHEGFFDFGSLDVSPADLLSVKSIPLSAAAADLIGEPFHGPMMVFEPWPIGIEIALPILRSVTLKAVTAEGEPASPADDELIMYSLWSSASENGGMEGSTSSSTGTQVLKVGTYLAQATLGELASPLMAFQVEATGGPTEIPLALQACPPFSVSLVDANGAPLGKHFIKLGTAASKAFPEPCRVPFRLKDGELQLEGILPGTYEVEFGNFGKESFVRTLELKPDSGPVVVTLP